MDPGGDSPAGAFGPLRGELQRPLKKGEVKIHKMPRVQGAEPIRTSVANAIGKFGNGLGGVILKQCPATLFHPRGAGRQGGVIDDDGTDVDFQLQMTDR